MSPTQVLKWASLALVALLSFQAVRVAMNPELRNQFNTALAEADARADADRARVQKSTAWKKPDAYACFRLWGHDQVAHDMCDGLE